MAVGVAVRDFSIVMVGDFNPAILHPSWFSAHGLIKNGEAIESRIEVVHKDVATWSLDWLKLFSDSDRLQLTTEQEAFAEPVRDLALGVLSILEHTPVRAIGLNFGGYYQFSDRDAYDRFGHELLPKTRWHALQDPRTLRVVVTATHKDGRRGSTNITVQASNRFPFCAYISANDHSQAPDDELGAGWAQSQIGEHWDSARQNFESIVQDLIKGY